MVVRRLSALAGTALIALAAACASAGDSETGTTDDTMRGDTTNTQMNRDTTITEGMDEDTTGL